MKYMNMLREQRAARVAERDVLVARLEGITQDASGAKRSKLTPDEERAFRAIKADVGRIDAEIAADDERLAEFEAIGERTAAAAKAPGYTAPAHNINVRTGADPWSYARDARNPADLRAVARDCVALDELTPAPSRELVTAALDDPADRTDDANAVARWAAAASSPDYLSGFAKLIADPQFGAADLTDAERHAWQRVREIRAVSIGVTTQGGLMLPQALEPSILITSNGIASPMTKLARRVLCNSNELALISSAGVSASWDNELEEVSDDTPTIASPTIPLHALRAFVPFSIEASQDVPDLVTELQRLISDEIEVERETSFQTGSGVGEPTGVITKLDATAGSEVTLEDTSGGAFALSDCYTLYKSLPPRFRSNNAVFLANIDIWVRTRRFGETVTGNAAYWADSLEPAMPPQLLGHGAYEASAMDAWAASGSKNLAAFVDPSRYVTAARYGTVVEVVPHLMGTSNPGRPVGARGLWAQLRVGGDLPTPEAGRLLKGKT